MAVFAARKFGPKLRRMFTSKKKADLADLVIKYNDMVGTVEDLDNQLKEILKKSHSIGDRGRY
jgi:hypothetical protein